MPHSATLVWVDSTDTGSTYNVYRSTTSGSYGTTPLNSTPLAAGTVTFTDQLQSPGKYFYVTTSVLNGEESLKSNEVAAVVLPSAPTGLAVTTIT